MTASLQFDDKGADCSRAIHKPRQTRDNGAKRKNSMRILIIEDEAKAGDYLRKGLQESGYGADLARNGLEGLNLALERDYQMIVLDVMLPQMDGWTVLQRLREHKDTPVLLLSARDAVPDRVKGLELGADDYLVKPFAFVELLARIKTLMRRGPLREVEMIRMADLEIDVLKRRVTRGATRIELTAKEFALLHLLAGRPGEVLSRAQIASQVWDMNFDSDTNVVDVAIRRLRAKIDEPFAVKLVHTARGMGYLMEARP
ncbi:two-component system copper resistance phosphate regulon response regulator CusR [Oxalobacteraceae bacterium GrIS 1.11]